jgi:AraC family transcriptional regulator of adaptative response/methylated-DNA-[protein]-cysteine methyltransferase
MKVRTTPRPQARDYHRIEKILHYLESHAQEKPTLVHLAKVAGLSPFHFQRLFKRWVGLSPKQFLDLLTLRQAKKLLEESKPLLEASLALGLSEPSRLHDLFVKVEAMTPGEYKLEGKGIRIGYGFFSSPFGECFIAFTEKGVCELSFINPSRPQASVKGLKKRWPQALIQKNPSQARRYAKTLFDRKALRKKRPLPLLLKGTDFQLKVWQALLCVPEGAAISYEGLAKGIQSPEAHRAVASAVAKNPIAYLIPCHRVIRKMGDWGTDGTRAKKSPLGLGSGPEEKGRDGISFIAKPIQGLKMTQQPFLREPPI